MLPQWCCYNSEDKYRCLLQYCTVLPKIYRQDKVEKKATTMQRCERKCIFPKYFVIISIRQLQSSAISHQTHEPVSHCKEKSLKIQKKSSSEQTAAFCSKSISVQSKSLVLTLRFHEFNFQTTPSHLCIIVSFK